MEPSIDMCLAQEARHLALARSTPLENQRRISTQAAAVWARLALAATQRRQRQELSHAAVAALPRADMAPDPLAQPLAAEWPAADLGLPSPGCSGQP